MSGNQPNQRIMNLSIRDLIFINSSAFNIFLPILIVLFIREVPQASQIVFSTLKEIDPISTTLLVILYSIFSMFIYYVQEEKYKVEGTEVLDLSVVFQRINLVFNFIPLIVWLLVILFNEGKNHLVSIFITVVYMALNIFLIRSKQKYNIIVRSNISYLVYLIALTMLIWGAYIFNDFPDSGYSGWIATILYTLVLVILITCVLFIDDKALTSVYSKVIAGIVMLSVLIVLKASYNIVFTPANIFLLYALVVRIVLFLISRCMIIVGDWIPLWSTSLINKHYSPLVESESDDQKKRKLKRTKTERTLVILITLLFLILFFRKSTRDQHDVKLLEIHNTRVHFYDYVSQWLKKDTTKLPIFLIAGQGGGSRAGSVFFQTLSELDHFLQDNILTINTISGSGTGAQFYLSAKYVLDNLYDSVFNNSAAISRANTILYQRDYISSSLFKILFTDYFRSKFLRKSSLHSRNYSLMNQEIGAYTMLSDSFGFNNIQKDTFRLLTSAWSQVYDSSKLSQRKFPLFFPTSYNVQHGVKAISSPVRLPRGKISPFYDILESLGPKQNVKVIQSVALNQLFPILSASATLDSFNYMDGGVYDNLGFETLFDLYKITTLLRDGLTPDRRIILISIENGSYTPNLKKGKLFDLSAVGMAGSNSIFSSVPHEHKHEGIKSLYCRDTFFELRVYSDSIQEDPTFIRHFKYHPSKHEVIMSRYLTHTEINLIRSRTNTVVHNFKNELEAFLTRSPESKTNDCYTVPYKVPGKSTLNQLKNNSPTKQK